MNTSLTGKETHILDGNGVEVANSAATGLSVYITSEEIEREIRAAADPFTNQLEKLCDFMRKLRRDTARRDEGTSTPAQGPTGPRGGRYDMVTGAPLTKSSKLLTGPMNPMMRQPDNITFTRQQPNRQNQPLLPEEDEQKLEQFNNSPSDHVATAINN